MATTRPHATDVPTIRTLPGAIEAEPDTAKEFPRRRRGANVSCEALQSLDESIGGAVLGSKPVEAREEGGQLIRRPRSRASARAALRGPRSRLPSKHRSSVAAEGVGDLIDRLSFVEHGERAPAAHLTLRGCQTRRHGGMPVAGFDSLGSCLPGGVDGRHWA